ncbi:tetratricopeptide repeat protein [Calothrix sp. PCC 6303]|uniref:tetratricopeptide repeat protein n=1 Tax=Calothrix sp. PCC 6303 TaxID=1170562 RepID=UPI0002A02BB9|nr:tetratricopeptide repeat protein [Calothrix sp. PCC 6303]AFZ03465.1 Tetratricopeptide TPR_1 repeat-containing protein [Calothrix sp. PCC 6303]
MDWITLLRSLQSDFLSRLLSGSLLHCQIEGQHSELTVISGERLRGLRDFCWQMAEKYKRVSPVRDVFISFLKGKLGEEVVRERLAGLITEVDYEKRIGGDGNVDFTLSGNPLVGVEVKSRYGSIDRVTWSVSAEEVAKNAVIVCVLIQENVHEAQSQYHMILAGFLPTAMIKLRTGRISFGIEQLLYGGGLSCYLQEFSSNSQGLLNRKKYPGDEFVRNSQKIAVSEEDKNPSQSLAELINSYLKTGDDHFARGNYEVAVSRYQEALKLDIDNSEIYYKIGLSKYHLKDYDEAIRDLVKVVSLNPHHLQALHKLGLARYQGGELENAIALFTQALQINPHDARIYVHRAEVRSRLGDNQGAIEDYHQAMKLNPIIAENQEYLQPIGIHPEDVEGFRNRGNSRYDIGDFTGAIQDYTSALQINPHDADIYYNRANVKYDMADIKGALDDYNQVIKINPYDAEAYFSRGNLRRESGDKQGAIEDFEKATELYRQEGKLAEHKSAKEQILDLEIEESLDILDF